MMRKKYIFYDFEVMINNWEILQVGKYIRPWPCAQALCVGGMCLGTRLIRPL